MKGNSWAQGILRPRIRCSGHAIAVRHRVLGELESGVVVKVGKGDVDVLPVALGELPHCLDSDRKLQSFELSVNGDGHRPRSEVTALPGDGVPPGHEVGEPACGIEEQGCGGRLAMVGQGDASRRGVDGPEEMLSSRKADGNHISSLR